MLACYRNRWFNPLSDKTAPPTWHLWLLKGERRLACDYFLTITSITHGWVRPAANINQHHSCRNKSYFAKSRKTIRDPSGRNVWYERWRERPTTEWDRTLLRRQDQPIVNNRQPPKQYYRKALTPGPSLFSFQPQQFQYSSQHNPQIPRKEHVTTFHRIITSCVNLA